MRFFPFLLLLSFVKISTASLPIGHLDTTDPIRGITGWALDNQLPYNNLIIHFYANAPAGSPGSVFIGQTIANISRPDVNQATGKPGNHGFYWIPPFDVITPCPIDVYAYAIDPHNQGNKLLTNSPRAMQLAEGAIINAAGPSNINISANSQFGGAIYSLIYGGVEFIDKDDHGRLLQSAASFYSSWSIGGGASWTAECYNPTEAGSHQDGNSICTSSKLLAFSNANNILQTRTQMAFYANPSAPTSSCPSPINTSILSNHILEKKVTIGLPGMAHAVKYEVKFSVPLDEVNLAMGQFEVITGYLPRGISPSMNFNKVAYYNRSTGTIYDKSSSSSFASSDPVIIFSTDGSHAMAVYSPDVLINDLPYSYYSHDIFSDCSKWNFVRRIQNIIPGSDYSFTGYLAIGTINDVVTTLGQLILTYPN